MYSETSDGTITTNMSIYIIERNTEENHVHKLQTFGPRWKEFSNVNLRERKSKYSCLYSRCISLTPKYNTKWVSFRLRVQDSPFRLVTASVPETNSSFTKGRVFHTCSLIGSFPLPTNWKNKNKRAILEVLRIAKGLKTTNWFSYRPRFYPSPCKLQHSENHPAQIGKIANWKWGFQNLRNPPLLFHFPDAKI